ncbi:MAG: hypothetical protein ACLPX5_09455 [Dissulfurispiraceae bacterium]
MKVDRLAHGSIDLNRGGIVFDKGFDKGIMSDGSLSRTTLTMRDPQGAIIWQTACIYLSKDFDRQKTLSELEAEDFKRL